MNFKVKTHIKNSSLDFFAFLCFFLIYVSDEEAIILWILLKLDKAKEIIIIEGDRVWVALRAAAGESKSINLTDDSAKPDTMGMGKGMWAKGITHNPPWTSSIKVHSIFG